MVLSLKQLSVEIPLDNEVIQLILEDPRMGPASFGCEISFGRKAT